MIAPTLYDVDGQVTDDPDTAVFARAESVTAHCDGLVRGANDEGCPLCQAFLNW